MVNEFRERLRGAGYKLTPARLAVLQVVCREEAHLTPAAVLKRGRELYPALGRATVYRTLELLTELGLLRPIYLDASSPHFIHAEGGHHHLVCSECGQVIEFNDCFADDLAETLQQRYGFHIDSHLLEFHGRCRQCSEAA